MVDTRDLFKEFNKIVQTKAKSLGVEVRDRDFPDAYWQRLETLVSDAIDYVEGLEE
jgi:hypothetical protein